MSGDTARNIKCQLQAESGANQFGILLGNPTIEEKVAWSNFDKVFSIRRSFEYKGVAESSDKETRVSSDYANIARTGGSACISKPDLRCQVLADGELSSREIETKEGRASRRSGDWGAEHNNAAGIQELESSVGNARYRCRRKGTAVARKGHGGASGNIISGDEGEISNVQRTRWVESNWRKRQRNHVTKNIKNLN